MLTCPADNRTNTLTIITYGMGVYWALSAASQFEGKVEIIDLRSLAPWDKDTVFASVRKHHRCMVITEEPEENGFAQSVAATIADACFEDLDAPVKVTGSRNLPAIPLNSVLEQAMLPNAEKVGAAIRRLLEY